MTDQISPESVELILAAWRNRFPSNTYAWPGAPESFAAEAARALGFAQRPAVSDEMALRAALAHNEDPRALDSCITVGEAKRIVEAALSLSSTSHEGGK